MCDRFLAANGNRMFKMICIVLFFLKNVQKNACCVLCVEYFHCVPMQTEATPVDSFKHIVL